MTQADPMQQYRPSTPISDEAEIEDFKQKLRDFRRRLLTGETSPDATAMSLYAFESSPINFAVALSQVLAEKDPA